MTENHPSNVSSWASSPNSQNLKRSPFPNRQKPFCFPFIVWERRTDATSSLYKAQNQLALPIIKSLDVLDSIGVCDLSILGVGTHGPIWEFYVCYKHPDLTQKKKVGYLAFIELMPKIIMQRERREDFDTVVDALRFLRMLNSIGTYFEDSFLPRVVDALNAFKEEKSASLPSP